MPKHQYRICPIDASEPDGIGAWLEAQAAQGYRLASVHLNGQILAFDSVEPEQARYCLYAHGQQAHCAEIGWQHVARFSREWDVYRAATPTVPQLDKNATPFLSTRRKVVRQHGIQAGWVLFFGIYCMIQFARMVSDAGGWVSMFIDYGIAWCIGIPMVYMIAAILSIFHAVQFYRCRKRLHPSGSQSPRACLPAYTMLQACLLLSLVVIWAIAAVSGLHISRGRDVVDIPFSQYEGDLGMPVLADIVPSEAQRIRETEQLWPESIHFSFIMEQSRYVAPTIIWLRQYDFNTVESSGAVTRSAFGYAASYYAMRTEALAERYAQELHMHMMQGQGSQVAVNGYESAVYYFEQPDSVTPVGTEHLLLRSGSIVISIIYYGSGSLYHNIDKFAR